MSLIFDRKEGWEVCSKFVSSALMVGSLSFFNTLTTLQSTYLLNAELTSNLVVSGTSVFTNIIWTWFLLL